jgi:biopolymer transport protein ExbB
LLLAITSIIGLAVIGERAWMLRWSRVTPPPISAALAECLSANDLPTLRHVCNQNPSPLGRLLIQTADHLDWPKAENVSSVETSARHEIVRLERGLVILEIIIGIAPLLGLVGTIIGMMTLFGDLGQTGLNDATRLAQGIALILRSTLAGLLIAIPALVTWSYFTKKIEVFAVEMEAICDEFIRRQYREESNDRE